MEQATPHPPPSHRGKKNKYIYIDINRPSKRKERGWSYKIKKLGELASLTFLFYNFKPFRASVSELKFAQQTLKIFIFIFYNSLQRVIKNKNKNKIKKKYIYTYCVPIYKKNLRILTE
jgi:hypothetical protein